MQDKIQLWMTFEELHSTLNLRLEKYLKSKYNLTVSEFLVISVLYKNKDEELTIHQLSNIVNLSHSAISRLVARLETCNTVNRQNSEVDRRSTIVRLTKQGKQDYEEILPEITSIIREIFQMNQGQIQSLYSKLIDF